MFKKPIPPFIIFILLFQAICSLAFSASRTLPNTPEELYLETIKRCVTHTIYRDIPDINYWQPPTQAVIMNYYPSFEQTMIGFNALDKAHELMKYVHTYNIPGDFIETGVWRGGLTILMRAFLKAYGDTTRKVWVADSFAGLPPPNAALYPADQGIDLTHIPWLAVPLEQVKKNFERYGLLDDQVRFLKGWFSQTLPGAPIQRLAIMRLDGDLYESTMDALVNLYPKLSIGGFVIIDDYGAVGACANAVHAYRLAHGITDQMYAIDWTGVYWQKTK